jgi:hypothetical protein
MGDIVLNSSSSLPKGERRSLTPNPSPNVKTPPNLPKGEESLTEVS